MKKTDRLQVRRPFYCCMILRRRVSWISESVRAMSTVPCPPGRIRRCLVVLRDCWTVGITRGIKSEMSLSLECRINITSHDKDVGTHLRMEQV